MTTMRWPTGITLAGAALQVLGLAIDAWLHAQDAALASRESVLALTNPGHALFAAGLALVIAGACLGWMRSPTGPGQPHAGARVASAVAPLLVLTLGAGSFAFAYSAGGLSGHHDDGAHSDSAHVADAGHDHDGQGIDESRHAHGQEIAIREAELRQLVLELDTARRATEKYRDIEVARAAGFVQVTQDIPGIAAHFVRFRGGSGGAFDPANPQILLYTRQSGEWQLVGVSYTSAVLTASGAPGPPPEGFAGPLDTWHFHENLCFVPGPRVFEGNSSACLEQGGIHVERTPWMLHVWLYSDAPEGIFAHADSRLIGSAN